MNAPASGSHLRALWNLHRDLKPRSYPHHVRTQVVRTRGAVDTAIAELTDLQRFTVHPGPVDLDQALNEQDGEQS